MKIWVVCERFTGDFWDAFSSLELAKKYYPDCDDPSWDKQGSGVEEYELDRRCVEES